MIVHMSLPPSEWDRMVTDVLQCLIHRQMSVEQAESFIWSLVEFAEMNYG